MPRPVVPKWSRRGSAGAERLIQRGWPALFHDYRRLVGTATPLVGLTLIAPVSFSLVVPALFVTPMALAYLEEHRLALLIAVFAALLLARGTSAS